MFYCDKLTCIFMTFHRPHGLHKTWMCFDCCTTTVDLCTGICRPLVISKSGVLSVLVFCVLVNRHQSWPTYCSNSTSTFGQLWSWCLKVAPTILIEGTSGAGNVVFAVDIIISQSTLYNRSYHTSDKYIYINWIEQRKCDECHIL